MQFISNLANVLAGQQKIDVGKSKSNVYVKSGLQVLQVFSPTCPFSKRAFAKPTRIIFKALKISMSFQYFNPGV